VKEPRDGEVIPALLGLWEPNVGWVNLVAVDRITFRRKLLRKEVIQPQVPLRLPCYDFTPITGHTLGAYLPKVSPTTSGTTDFRGVTGGVYKARERIHRGMLIHDY
jgi:hypothetical protein